MTDEQVIIHNADVSKCMFFNKNHKEDDVQIKNYCELQHISCEEFEYANCYFKKWKRKEQEYEELRQYYNKCCKENAKELEEILEKYNQISKDLYAKEQECERLKKIINEAKNSKLDLKSYYVGKAVQDEYEQQLDQLKQILAEIKEIAECCQTPANCKDYCQFYNECIDGGLPLILQKISECEVE